MQRIDHPTGGGLPLLDETWNKGRRRHLVLLSVATETPLNLSLRRSA
jgi:hypothetical protein